MKEFKVGIIFNIIFSKYILFENKLECLCVEFCKGNFMLMISKIIDDFERIVRL